MKGLYLDWGWGCLLIKGHRSKLFIMQAVRGCEVKSPYIICFSCEKIAEEPRLCPKCTKGFCNSCLFITITSLREECPSCCSRVREQDYLQPEAVLALVTYISDKVRKDIKRGQQREHCLEHELPLGYFCVECNHPLCADCGLLTNQHTGHRFVSYRDIYERIKKRVFDQFPKFDRKIKSLHDRKASLYSKIENLYEQYRRFKKYFEEAYINYTQRIQNAGKSQELNINARFEANQHRLAELEHLRDNIYEEMEKKTQLTLIKQSGTLIESINALSCQEPSFILLDKMEECTELYDLIPDYVTWLYRLDSFSSKNGIVYSQPKVINGVEWKLKVYPKGNGLAREKYLSVFVEMSKALATQNKYEYRIQLINPVDPSLSVKREYCSTFEIGQCWGYNQFEPLEQLQVKEFIENDSLLFQIGIRNRNYRSLVQDQLLYLELLKNQIKEKEKSEEESKIKKIKSIREKIILTEKKTSRARDQRSPEKIQREFSLTSQERQEVPFEQSQTYGLIQQYLKKQQLKKQ